MSHLMLHCVLFAQKSPLDNFAREFQGRQTRLNSGYLTTGLVIVLALVLAVWLLSQVLERYAGRRPGDSSLMLFLSLCRAHRLRLPEWWLLWRLARVQQLKDPARLFLEPARLDPANLSPVLRLKTGELDAIRRRLFAGTSGDATASREPTLRSAESASPPPQPEHPPWSAIPSGWGAKSDAPGWPPLTTPGEPPPAASK